MEIKRFDEFVNESQEFEFELDYDYDDLDEGLMDAIKGIFGKQPSLKDPKTAKDFGALVNMVADKFSVAKVGTDNIAKAPVLIATKLVNLLTMFLNKQGPFKDRTGAPVATAVPLIGKDGKPKAPVTGGKSLKSGSAPAKK